MKFIVAAVALAATALAAPSVEARDTATCKFGQYRCSADGKAIVQCDVQGHWVTIGDCPNGSSCHPIQGIPYCTKKVAKRQDSGYCANPGTYSCSSDGQGIDVCDSQNQIQVSYFHSRIGRFCFPTPQ